MTLRINSILVDNYGNKKPSHSYADLIRMAITSTDSKRMTLSEIYDFVGMYSTTPCTTSFTVLYDTIIFMISYNLEKKCLFQIFSIVPHYILDRLPYHTIQLKN